MTHLHPNLSIFQPLAKTFKTTKTSLQCHHFIHWLTFTPGSSEICRNLTSKAVCVCVCPVMFPLTLSTGHNYMDVARPWSVSVLLPHTSANTRVHVQFIVPSAECVVKTPVGFLLFSLVYKKTPLFCRFKLLWLTLCQLHNAMEIEVV